MTGLLCASLLANVIMVVAWVYIRGARTYMDVMTEDKPTPTRPFPSDPTFRRFVAYRYKDVTGISGPGVVAEGVVFSDGWAVTHWLDRPPMHEPKTETWHNPGVAPFEKISGHGGATKVRWVDQA